MTRELKDEWDKSQLFDTPGEASAYLQSATPLLIVLNWGRENGHLPPRRAAEESEWLPVPDWCRRAGHVQTDSWRLNSRDL